MAQAAEDVPAEHQHGEIDRREHAGQPRAAHQRDHDGRRHHVGGTHVGEMPVRDVQLAGVHPVSHDALADQRADHLPGQADQCRPGVAERPVGTEDGQRDQHRPDHDVPGRNQRGKHQREDRLMLEVRHARAGPRDQPGLRGRGQEGVAELDGDEAGQVDTGEGVPATPAFRRHVRAPGWSGPGQPRGRPAAGPARCGPGQRAGAVRPADRRPR